MSNFITHQLVNKFKNDFLKITLHHINSVLQITTFYGIFNFAHFIFMILFINYFEQTCCLLLQSSPISKSIYVNL